MVRIFVTKILLAGYLSVYIHLVCAYDTISVKETGLSAASRSIKSFKY